MMKERDKRVDRNVAAGSNSNISNNSNSSNNSNNKTKNSEEKILQNIWMNQNSHLTELKFISMTALGSKIQYVTCVQFLKPVWLGHK